MGKHKVKTYKSQEDMESEETRREFARCVREYQQSLKQFIVTSRFNTQTITENREFIAKTQKIGCVYCCPDPIARHIPMDAPLFVLEMNNDINRIVGIGLVRNHAFMHKYNVYSERTYNRYIYYGKHHIKREDMSEYEDRIMKVFDILCFTGNKHMKRGQGIKSFPTETLYKCKRTLDLVSFISEMFKSRLQKPNT